MVQINTPKSIKEAWDLPKKKEWKEATDKEYKSLKEMQTWDLVELPEGRKAVSNKWVFRVKQKADGSIDKYKARLVAKGYSQEYGVDYQETFAPVVKASTLRSILAYGVKEQMEIHQMDVQTAYLNGELKEEIYMEQPPGYIKEGEEKLVCHLKRSLYGLKQAGRCWNQKLVGFLKEKEFTQLKADTSVFIRKDAEMILLVYVDDMVLLAKNKEEMREFRELLMEGFKMMDMGPIHYFLGMEFKRQESGELKVNQERYVETLLDRFGQRNSRVVSTPADANVVLQKNDGSSSVDAKEYQALTGSLLYLALNTRPDIQFAVGVCARYNSSPTETHKTAALRILKYLKGMGVGVSFYPENKAKISGFVDSDFARDVDDRKSTSGYVFLFGESPISWYSGKQKCVSVSTSAAEYIALGQAVREALYLGNLFKEMGIDFFPIQIREDNQAALAMVKNPVHHSRQKHIDVQHHFVREEVEKETVVLEYCPTTKMAADILTKPLPKAAFKKILGQLSLFIETDTRIGGSTVGQSRGIQYPEK